MQRTTSILFAAGLAVLLVCSCKTKHIVNTPIRSENISVYTSENPDIAVNNIQVPFEGTKDGEIRIYSSVPFSMDYMVDPKLDDQDAGWFKIKDIQQTGENQLLIRYDASSLIDMNTLGRRSGTLSLMNPEIDFGKIMSVRQGYVITYDVGFDTSIGQSVNLSGNMTCTTLALNACNLHYYDYISFNAYATTEYDPEGVIITMDVDIAEGNPHFDANGAKSIRLNVPVGEKASKDNIHYLLLSNGGDRIGGGLKLRFSTDNPVGTTVHFENLRVYKVSEAELEDLVDDEEDYNPDGENW